MCKRDESRGEEKACADTDGPCGDRFRIAKFNSWEGVAADLVITDPPFGIDFSGKATNYNRDVGRVVEGYVEWPLDEYEEKMRSLLAAIYRNVKEEGQALVFSGWNNSHVVQRCAQRSDFHLEGKLYWSYNFAPYCTRRPAHNVYEIFWLVKGEDWYYSNECSTHHCQNGEANLSTLQFRRDYKKNMPKYPTRLPFKLLQCLLEHFSRPGDLVFDPLAGSGMVGIVAEKLERDFVLGDLNKNAKRVYRELLKHYDEGK